MNTAGGFLLDATQSLAGPSRAIQQATDDETGSVPARKLSAKQEVRLMNYLDDAFLQVNRGFSKRHNPATSSVPTLDAFLQAYDAILSVLASIPPLGPSATLLVSYLLRLTNELLDGIIGYDIRPYASQNGRPFEDDDENGEGQETMPMDIALRSVVDHLGALDRVWSCVLRGQLIDLPVARRNVERSNQGSDDSFPSVLETQALDSQNESHQESNQLAPLPGRYPPIQPSSHERDGRTIMGSKGYATVAQTNRIRLRNLLTLGKEHLFVWMRTQLDVPIPPRIEAEDDDDDDDGDGVENGTAAIKPEEAIEQPVGGLIMKPVEADEGLDLEEVDTSGSRKVQNTQNGQSTRYDDLFARKIDPDASDSEEGDDEEGSDRKRLISPPEAPSAKHRKLSSPILAQIPAATPASVITNDMESTATFSGSAAVMRWDVKFARLFSHTLRCLSDIQEVSSQREERAKKDGAD